MKNKTCQHKWIKIHELGLGNQGMYGKTEYTFHCQKCLTMKKRII